MARLYLLKLLCAYCYMVVFFVYCILKLRPIKMVSLLKSNPERLFCLRKRPIRPHTSIIIPCGSAPWPSPVLVIYTDFHSLFTVQLSCLGDKISTLLSKSSECLANQNILNCAEYKLLLYISKFSARTILLTVPRFTSVISLQNCK